MKHLNTILIKLKIFDTDGTLSLTSVALMVVLVKVAVAKDVDIMTLCGLFMALLSYNAKKFSIHKKVGADRKHELEVGTQAEKLEELHNKIHDARVASNKAAEAAEAQKEDIADLYGRLDKVKELEKQLQTLNQQIQLSKLHMR